MKKGFTLMELLVYMAIVGIIVVVAGQAFSNSTKFRVRTQNMLRVTQEAEDVGLLFKEDVQQTGTKSSKEAPVAISDNFYLSPDVYMALAPAVENPDSSSFKVCPSFECPAANCPAEGCPTTEFKSRRMVYDSVGHYKRVEEITWTYEPATKKLFRTCVIKPSNIAAQAAQCPGTAVEIADSVSFFKVVPATPGVVSGTNPRLLPNPNNSAQNTFRLNPRINGSTLLFAKTEPEDNVSEAVTIREFATNYDFENSTIIEDGMKRNELYVAAFQVNNSWDKCQDVDLEKGKEYEIRFDVIYSADAIRTFCQDRDHASVGFRKKTDGSKIPQVDDFLFYPPQSNVASEVRSMRFTVDEDVEDVCLAFTFATYSPVAGTGSIQIANLGLWQVPSSNYEFNDDFANTMTLVDKKNVKAVRLDLTIKRNGEAGNVSVVVPVPSNGPRD